MIEIPIEQLEVLAAGHEWPALCGLLLMTLLTGARQIKVLGELWKRLPKLLQPVPLVLAVGIPEYSAQLAAGEHWVVAASAALVAGVLAVGGYHAVWKRGGGLIVTILRAAVAALLKRGKVTAGAIVLLLTGCAAWQDTAQSGLDVAQAVCENELMQQLLREDKMLSPVAADLAQNACAVLAATKPGLDAILAQADQARAPRGRVLAAEARARGAL